MMKNKSMIDKDMFLRGVGGQVQNETNKGGGIEQSSSNTNTNNKSNVLNRKRGIADKIAKKIDDSESQSFQEFTSQDDGKRDEYAVGGIGGSDVNFGSEDGDNHWIE